MTTTTIEAGWVAARRRLEADGYGEERDRKRVVREVPPDRSLGPIYFDLVTPTVIYPNWELTETSEHWPNP